MTLSPDPFGLSRKYLVRSRKALRISDPGRQGKGYPGPCRALLVLSFCSLLSASARPAQWSAFDLVTGEARPRPPVTTRETSAALAVATDPAFSYQTRALSVLKLAGSTRERVVKAIRGLLLCPAETREAETFRAACAAALGWSAHRGSRAAVAALYEGLYAPQTHMTEGRAVARALLNALGPLEAIKPLYRRLVGAGSGRDNGDRLDLAFSWTWRQWQPYHSGRRNKRELWGELADRLATEVSRMSPKSMAVMLKSRPCREVLRDTLGLAPRSELGDLMLRRLEKGDRHEREALAAFFSPSLLPDDNWSQTYRRFLYSLDSRQIRTLRRGSAGLSDRAGRELTRLIRAVCYGREQEVCVRGKSIEEVLLGTLERLGPFSNHVEQADADAANPSYPDGITYMFVWEHVDLHPVRFEDPMRHPSLQVIRSEKYPFWERSGAAGSLARSQKLGGLGVSEEFVRTIESIFTSVQGRSAGFGWATKDDKIRPFFAADLARLAIRTSPAGKRREATRRLLLRSDPLCRARLLEDLADDAYMRMDRREPVWLAEHCLGALDALMAVKDRWPENYGDRTLCAASGLVRKLTPEVILPLREAKVKNLKRIVTGWREWLQRFRKLPVFRKRR